VHHITLNNIFRGYLLLIFIVYYEFNENISGSMHQLNRYYTTYIYIISYFTNYENIFIYLFFQ
jgi:hypothetical protein